MLRFSTKLYVKDSLTAEVFIRLAAEWVSGGPHFHFGQVTWDGKDEFMAESPSEKLLIFKYGETAAVHLENREETQILWTSDFVLTQVGGKRVVATQLYSEQENFGAKMPSEFHRPYLLRMLMERGYGGMDGDLPVNEEPVRITRDNKGIVRALIAGEADSFMPVVYVPDPLGKAESASEEPVQEDPEMSAAAEAEQKEKETVQPVSEKEEKSRGGLLAGFFGRKGEKNQPESPAEKKAEAKPGTEAEPEQKPEREPETPAGSWKPDVKKLAESLGGVAHVLTADSPEVSREVTEGLESEDFPAGAVMIFFPGGSSQCIWPEPGMEEADFRKEVSYAVFRKLILKKVDDRYSWQKIRYSKLAEASREYQEIAEICDSLLDEKQAQLDANMERIEELELEVSRLKNRLLAYDYEGSRKNLCKDTRELHELILKGKEQDLYEEEIRDVVLKVLKKERASMAGDPNQEETRKYHILSDLLENNEIRGRGEELKKQLKEIFGNGEPLNTSKKKQLQEMGFEILDGGKHYKLVYRGDERYLMVAARTPSDYRAYLNTAMQMTNKLFN